MKLMTDYLGGTQQILPFEPEHLHRIDFKGDTFEYMAEIPDYFDYIVENAYHGLTWTGMRDGKPIIIFGCRPIFEKNFEAWMIPGVQVDSNAIALVKGGRALFSQVEEEYELNRLQIAVRCGNETAVNYARALYFKVESTLKAYGPEGQDYYMMTRKP